MNNIEMTERLVAVFNALNNVEVKGINNIGALAGSLQMLKEIIEARAAEQKESQEPADG